MTEKEVITTAYDGRCFLHLYRNTYVVAKEFKNKIYIHIRNYEKKGNQKYPTKQGIALT